MTQKTIVTLTGPSLSGKSTLAQHLMRLDSNLVEMISTTTREPRGYEVEGKHYYFVDDATFNTTPMVQTTRFAGKQYGMSVLEAERVFGLGATPIVVVDPFGAQQLSDYAKANGLRHLSVFVSTPRHIRLERFLTRFAEDKGANPATYVHRLENMLGVEEDWYTRGDWHTVVHQYDEATQDRVATNLLRLIFGRAPG